MHPNGPQVKNPCLNKKNHNQLIKPPIGMKGVSAALQVLKLCRCSPIPSPWLTSFQTVVHHQQILYLHHMALLPPNPKETWLSPEDTASPSGCSGQRLFLSFYFHSKLFAGEGELKIPVAPCYCF